MSRQIKECDGILQFINFMAVHHRPTTFPVDSTEQQVNHFPSSMVIIIKVLCFDQRRASAIFVGPLRDAPGMWWTRSAVYLFFSFGQLLLLRNCQFNARKLHIVFIIAEWPSHSDYYYVCKTLPEWTCLAGRHEKEDEADNN